MPANPEGLLQVEQREAIYLADRFEWAAPGDQQEDAWLVRFCDRDCGDAVFTGPGAEAEAWAHWNRYAPAFNIYVFRLARFEQSLARPGMEELREATSIQIGTRCDICGTAAPKAFASECDRPECPHRTSTTDYRLNLAKALFEAAYRQNLRAWSDETRDYWLAKADRALALSPTTAPIDQAQGVGDG